MDMTEKAKDFVGWIQALVASYDADLKGINDYIVEQNNLNEVTFSALQRVEERIKAQSLKIIVIEKRSIEQKIEIDKLKNRSQAESFSIPDITCKCQRGKT